ncbi:MAG: carboxypeptidase regulatory-like domain-containing protein [Candidatus Eremiobacteraeota bacterium]|nr:carboxypeptidase regulatory-like domain-containing protein [Candidatus Eremiobacteraeota bacterium]MBV8332431.1 carboxypeptidase regulatory-like domain-containing protein [Candidatus Eremiobacteraeota bacterium]MBV8435630.1 carboxypeptidase regulatory-like domain-containing protein [Candidatus Eremiobacteraeota bacterium]MBV8721856.1 carboxypeptidase regulatory-like domain-containing protein [Candidatus Eremiobacteraeota bacterium]
MLLSLMLAAGLMTPAWPLDDYNTPVYGMVRGTVKSESHQPISNAKVLAYSNVGFATATTDTGGNFYFLTLLPGVYFVRAYAPAVDMANVGNIRPCKDDNPIRVAAGLTYLADFQFSPACAYEAIPVGTIAEE